jgi:exonuclease III
MGLTDGMQRKILFNGIRRLDPDITILTETKLRNEDYDDIKRSWGQTQNDTNMIMDCHMGPNHKKGVAILIKNGLQCKIHKVMKSGRGSHIMVAINLQGIDYVLTNFYGESSTSDEISLATLNNMINDINITNIMHKGQLIIARDFNFVMSCEDSTSTNVKPRTRAAMQLFLQQNNLIDLWSELNDDDQIGFTRVQNQSKLRLDRIYVQGGALQDPSISILQTSEQKETILCSVLR